MTKKIKWLLVGMGIFLGLMLLVPIGLRFYLETDHARDLIQAQINKAIPGTISWEKFRFSLFKGEFELRNALLKGPSHEELAGFDRVFIDFSWGTLLHKELTVSELTLERPRGNIRMDKAGKLNLMDAFPQPKPKKEKKEKPKGLPVNVIVKSLRLDQGSLRYEMEAKNLKAAVQDINLAASDMNLLEQSANLDVQIRDGHVESPKINTEIDELKLKASLRQGQIDPLVLNLDTDAGTLAISGNIQDLKQPLLDIALDLGVSLDTLRENFHLKPELTGNADLHVNARGRLSNPEADLRLNYGGGNLGGKQIDGISLTCQLKDRQLTLRPLEVNAASGDLNLQGDVNLQQAFANGFLSPKRDLDALSYNLSLKGNGIDIETLLVGKKNVKGVVNSDILVQGKGISPKTLSASLILNLFADQVSASRIAAPIDLSVKTSASLDKGLVTVEELDVQAGEIRLGANGGFHLVSKELDATLTLNAPNLESNLQPLGLKDIHGNLNLGATISGSVGQPIFDCKLKGDQLRFQDIVIGDVRLDAASDPSGMVRISTLDLENQGSVLQGKGTVQVFQKDSLAVDSAIPLDISLGLKDVEPRDFLSKLPVSIAVNGKLNLGGNLNDLKAGLSLQGEKLAVDKAVQADAITLTAEITGNVRQPKGTVNIHGKNFDFGAQKVRDIKLDAQIDGKTIRIDALDVMLAPGATIRAAGQVSLDDKSYQIRLTSKGMSLDHIDKVRQQKVAKGNIRVDLSGQGTFDNPQIEGDIALDKLKFNGNTVDAFQLHVGLRDHVAQVSGNLNFDLDGSFHLKDKDFSATLVFNETDLRPYLKLANQTDLDGTLTGRIEASGNAGAIDNIRATADLSKLVMLFKGKEMVRSGDLSASFKNGEISLPGSHLRLLQNGQLEISGTGKPKGPLNLQVKGEIPLKIVSQFTDAVPDLKGDVGISGSVTGNLPKPDIRAQISLKNVGMTVPGLSQQLHDLNGQIRLTPESVVLEHVKGQLDSGHVELNGDIGLKAFQPTTMNVKLDADALPLNIPDMLDMLLNANLQLIGTLEKSEITGEAVILEGTYHKDVDLSLISGLKNAAQKKRETSPKASKPMHPFLKNMALDISVKRRNPFLVENNLALLDINPDVRVHGKLDHPLVSGRAKIESGTITYQKKEFEVRKGVIDFLNPYEIEPTLDIESQVRVREWLITLEVTGTPEQLIFKLTSDPQEEHGDILSLLVLGKMTRDLGKSNGGTSKLPAQMVADIVESTVGEDIRKATGLDILELEFQEDENAENSDRVKVTLGKALSRRMTVKYAMESKNGEMVQKGIAEYKFLENMMITGFQDSKGTFGGELRFRMEFR